MGMVMVMQRDKAIGVFDSGVGGLTVLDAIRHRLPNERLVYLGDTARVPYGNKAPSTIVRYSLACAKVLIERDVKALVIACNTASAHGLSALATAYPVPVIGVIEPVARRAAQLSQSGTVGVIGTRATVSSEAYRHALSQFRTGLSVLQQACPLFVPLVEEGWQEDDVTIRIAERYLRHFEGSTLDVLILGCTHYPRLRIPISSALAALVPQTVQLCDSATATAEALHSYLLERDLLRQGQPSQPRYLVTDDPEHFRSVGMNFLDDAFSDVQHIDWL